MHLLKPENLRCEHLSSPGGLNTDAPRFSWALAGEGRGQRQTAWRIVLRQRCGDAANVLWDSGKVISGQNRLVAYDGPRLPSAARLEWQLVVWNADDAASEPSEWATLFSGLPHDAWNAQWIARYFVLPAGREAPADSPYDNPWQARPADYMRRDFTLDTRPQQALLHVTALGLYEFHINGNRVGHDVMAPGWTDYHRRVEYQTHDVTGLLRDGENVIGAILGEGWYSGRVGHNQRRAGNHYGGRPALLCELHLHDGKGGVQIIRSDADWQTRQGAICYSDFLMGEMFDARRELTAWNTRPGPLEGWQPVEVFVPDPAAPLLEAARAQPVREVAELEAHFSHYTASGAAIYDLGQNIAGYMRLEANGREGDRFTLRHAEVLDGGELYVANLRHAVAKDVFIADGKGARSFKPHFTFHGFRYVELTLPEGMTPDDVRLTGIAIQTDAPVTGTITTGHAMVNQLLSNIFWSQRTNFIAVPTDCPQRDERYGWTADAQVFWRTAGYGMDVAAFLTKWMVDIADGQSPEGAYPDVAPTKPLNPYRLTPQPGAPGWGDAPIILGWHHWLRYADREFLETHYAGFEAWMEHIRQANPDFLRKGAVYNNYGDWLSIGPATDRTLVATAYWGHIATLMARIANVLGRQQDRARYNQLADSIRSAFCAAWWQPDGHLASDTQTAYLLALDFGLLPQQNRKAAAERLVTLIREAGGHLQTGFLGVRHLCPVLSDHGAEELAFDLLLGESYPGWGFSIRHGATTIWERWDGWTPERGFQSASMNSFNHYAYGAVGEWIWSRIAGIDWDEEIPGYELINFRPLFDERLGHCEATYQAPAGTVTSNWHMTAGNAVRWHIVIPPGCGGRVGIPAGWSLEEGPQPDTVLASGAYDLVLKKTG